jgi:hypothetical protein
VQALCTNLVKICTGTIKRESFDDTNLRPDFSGGRENRIRVYGRVSSLEARGSDFLVYGDEDSGSRAHGLGFRV